MDLDRKLSVEDFLAVSDRLPLFDVRSPLEYERGHISGAINLPLFEDLERAEIGTLYHRKGQEEALRKGLAIAGDKMNVYIDKVKAATNSIEILLYCWRGGMRSASLAWLFELAGFKVDILEGGYKAFRNHLLTSFSKTIKLMIIGGMTGSGKTELLGMLRDQGEQVLDLEAMAVHRGSAFGHIGLPKQPSPQQFENNLFDHWRKLDFSKTIWIEDESQCIGKVFIPSPLWQQMITCPVVSIEVPFTQRIERLVRDYTDTGKSVLLDAFSHIERRIGSANMALANNSIQNNDYFTAAEIALKYYDKAYKHNLKKRKSELVNIMCAGSSSLAKIVESLIVLKNVHYG
jgi:tRNA 2-selenouridine synthase